MKQYTPQQQKFLDVLFEEAEGDVLVAKRLAGYSDNTPTSQVVRNLEDEIFEMTKKYIARTAPKAAYAMHHILQNPTALGNKERLAAAKEVLDRTGLGKVDKIEVKSETPLFILPPKAEDAD
jgi:hypothetical protein